MSTARITSRPVRQRGDVIRSLRISQGVPTHVFAKRCGFKHAGSLTNIEGEVRQASWVVLHRIARELAVPIRTILRDPEAADEPNGAAA